MDYILYLRSGRTIVIEDVVGSPSLVTNDGTSYKVKSQPYRDIFPISTASSSSTLSPAVASIQAGYRTVPTYFFDTSGSTTGMKVNDYDVITDDITRTSPLPPKQADEEWTHWKFTNSDGNIFYVPFENVEAMGTKIP